MLVFLFPAHGVQVCSDCASIHPATPGLQAIQARPEVSGIILFSVFFLQLHSSVDSRASPSEATGSPSKSYFKLMKQLSCGL
jgi:hypothetical protein